MKKFIGLSIACMMFCALSFAQNVSTTKSKTACVPTEACAKKLGISLEECMALCKGRTNATSADMVPVENGLSATCANQSAKSCCVTPEECSEKMGISVEACLQQCKGHETSDKKVASAVMTNPDESGLSCCKKATASCKR